MSEKNKKLISTKPLSLLIVIVHREKVDFYVDALQQFAINMQVIVAGNGTTKTTVYVDEIGTKAVIFNVIADENISKALEFLDDKFSKIKDGKGIAYTVPLTKVMGAQLYNFFSNNKSTFI